MSERVNKISVSISFLVGVITSLVAILSIFSTFSHFKPGSQLSVTIRSFAWRLPASEISKECADQLVDIKSMYTIDIRNVGDIKARHIILIVPDVKIVQINREGEKKQTLIDRPFIDCGDLLPASVLSITAWSTGPPIKERAEDITITTDTGRSVRIKVVAIEGPFARLIDRTIIGVCTVSLLTLIMTLLWWRKKHKGIYVELADLKASGEY